MEIFRCVVEDNNDPKHLGRVRLRVFGIHSKDLDSVKTEELPWSNTLGNVGNGNGFGISLNVINGSHGYCVNLNDSYTEFLFLGNVNKIFTDFPDKKYGFRDQNDTLPKRLNIGENPLTYGQKPDKNITMERIVIGNFKEDIDTSNKAEYPYNKVYEDLAGNIIEIDATKNNERIKVQHKTGARVEINKDGDITIQSAKNGNIFQQTEGLLAIGADGNIILKGDIKIIGNLEVTGELTDKNGNLSSLRNAFNNHIHTQGADSDGNAQVPTNKPAPDPNKKFIWNGKPK